VPNIVAADSKALDEAEDAQLGDRVFPAGWRRDRGGLLFLKGMPRGNILVRMLVAELCDDEVGSDATSGTDEYIFVTGNLLILAIGFSKGGFYVEAVKHSDGFRFYSTSSHNNVQLLLSEEQIIVMLDILDYKHRMEWSFILRWSSSTAEGPQQNTPLFCRSSQPHFLGNLAS
jgi:hypothetical protein